jgi:hypothetical protein
MTTFELFKQHILIVLPSSLLLLMGTIVFAFLSRFRTRRNSSVFGAQISYYEETPEVYETKYPYHDYYFNDKLNYNNGPILPIIFFVPLIFAITPLVMIAGGLAIFATIWGIQLIEPNISEKNNLSSEIENYKNFGILESARGKIFLILSIGLPVILFMLHYLFAMTLDYGQPCFLNQEFGFYQNADTVIRAVIFIVLGILALRGSRWGMILAFVFLFFSWLLDFGTLIHEYCKLFNFQKTILADKISYGTQIMWIIVAMTYYAATKYLSRAYMVQLNVDENSQFEHEAAADHSTSSESFHSKPSDLTSHPGVQSAEPEYWKNFDKENE